MNKIKNTAIIIVNWNGQHLLGDCLSSLTRQTDKGFKIVLVDNGSTDNSVNFVEDNFKNKKIVDEKNSEGKKGRKELLNIEIIKLEKNTGFARGNNIGISKALEDKNIQNVVLLNNDTKVKDNFLEQLLFKINDEEFNKQYNKIGALAPKILLTPRQDLGVEKIVDAVGARVGLDGRGYSIGHGKKDNGQYNKVQEVFGFCGGAVLLRREMLKDVEESQKSKVKSQNVCIKNKNQQYSAKVGSSQDCEGWTFAEYQEFFDDNFFAYYEDADFSCRMRLRGWSTITVPEAVVYHLHSATADTVKSKTFKAYYLNRNRFLMMFKNFPAGVLWKGVLQIPKSYSKKNKGGEEVRSPASYLAKSRVRMVGVMLRVGWSLLINLPKLINQRWKIQRKKIVRNGEFEKWLH